MDRIELWRAAMRRARPSWIERAMRLLLTWGTPIGIGLLLARAA